MMGRYSVRIFPFVFFDVFVGGGEFHILLLHHLDWSAGMCFLEMKLHQRSFSVASGLTSAVTSFLLSVYLHHVIWLKSPFIHLLVPKKYLLSTCYMLRIAFSMCFCPES